MRTVAGLATLTALIALPLIGPNAASAADPTCQGQPVTIAAGGGTVTGTDGADVISVDSPPSNGKVTINALAGDDLICVRGFQVTLDAGAGNDSVVDESVNYLFVGLVTANLGPGDDRFIELGDVPDMVDHAAEGGDPSGADVIVTGPTVDYVGSGKPGEPNHDVIDFGDGARTLDLVLPPGSSMSATSDLVNTADHVNYRSHAVTLTAPRSDRAGWTIDTAGPVTRNGVQVADLRGFGGSYAVQLGRRAKVSFVGHDESSGTTLSAGTVEADLGGGSDRLILGSAGVLPSRVRVQAGPQNAGHPDRVEVYNLDGRVQLSLAGRLRLDDKTIGRVRGFEQAVVVARRIDVVGSSGDDSLLALGCSVHLRGGRGDDELRPPTFGEREAVVRCRGRARYFEHGEAGDDALTGYRNDDVLTGGSGTDRADGGPGRDVCSAEQTRSC